MKSLFHLKAFFKRHIYQYALGILVLIIVDILQLIPLIIIGTLTDDLMRGTVNKQHLIYYSLIIIILAISMAICRFLWRYLIIGTSRKLETWLRKMTFNHILSLPTSFFDKTTTGHLTALCTNDIRAVRMFFGIGTIMFIDAIFMSIIICITMFFSINTKLTILAILPLPFIALTVFLMGKAIKMRFFDVQKNFAQLTNKTQESLSGIRVTKAFNTEQIDLEDFEKYNLNSYKSYISLAKFDSALYPMVQFISAISLVIALSYGGTLVIDKVISLGELVTFIGYLSKLTWPMTATGYVFNLFQRSLVSMSRIANLLEEPCAEQFTLNEIDSSHNQSHTDDSFHISQPTIRFDNICFKYNNTQKFALENINLTLKPNQTLGIVGRTGCGKSTIPQLLLKLYPPYSGNIYIDDIPISNLSDTLLRKNISFVPQETFLFAKSIRENIAFFDDNASEEDIIKAAKLAQFHDEVMSFPDGYNTQLGERGINLSGGQKQRLSIARAILRDTPIIIFDDSLSAVDTHTENIILNNIKNTTHNKQVIIIAHRISSIAHADHILVMDKGKIVEEGNHLELLEMGGAYYDIYKSTKG